MHITPVDLTVAPGGRAANVQLGRQRVNAMAGRGRNPPQPQPLQGADPALVQILQMMQNRDANRDNSRKQFLMFPKESFTGQDKKLAKSHWAECRGIKQGMVFRIHVGIYSNKDTMAHTRRLVVTS